MVTLSRIYTRTGDDGTTALGDMSRTSKTDPRLLAFADVDEANCAIGEVVAGGAREHLPEQAVALLVRVQNDLFDVGADLCTPLRPDPAHPPLRLTDAYVADLESAIDAHNDALPPLRSFVLPGGTPTAARLHTARTVARRAERATWVAIDRYGTRAQDPAEGPGGVSPLTARYLNRLSDLLFVLARVANGGEDVLWAPGGGRAPVPEDAPPPA
ncbi:MAG: cob(I)yrinic acid a,c-diamide adenosyltransferase [Kineosporiaceae bacterium]